MVILLSTRGTAGSDIWFMCLADKPMVRGYHLTDYDWTPLSQNPAQTCDDTVSASASGGSDIRGSTAFRRPRWRSHSDTAVSRLGSAGRSGRKYTHPMQRRGAKSFVDDLVLSRGVVLSRAAASLRSIETKPFDWKICPLWTDTSPWLITVKSKLCCPKAGGCSLSHIPRSWELGCVGRLIFLAFS